MKQAYLILAHKNPQQLLNLINVLDHSNCFFLIHVDKKVDITKFVCLCTNRSNIWFCRDRICVNWGGFSQVRATLKLIDDLLTLKWPVNYVHLLSGQDFPIQTNEEIISFFSCQNGQNFIDYFPLPRYDWDMNGGLDNLHYWWYIDDMGYDEAKKEYLSQCKDKPKRSYPLNIQPYGGSQWWSLHIDCVSYIGSICKKGNPIYDHYEYTHVPDEMFFQTVIMNSPHKYKTVRENYRYYDWSGGPGHPLILTKNDYFKLVESKKIFARKFDIEVDAIILNYINAYRNKKSKRNLPCFG